MKICLVGKAAFHTEIAGFFIYALQSHDLSVYHPPKNSPYNCLPYYQKILSKPLNYVSKVDEDNYDMIIFLTSREIVGHPIKDKRKVYLVAHRPQDIYHKYNNISLTPLIPVKNVFLPIYRYSNTQVRNNTICLVGISSGGAKYRDIQDFKYVLEMIEQSNYTFLIFSRPNEKIQKMVSKFKRSHFLVGIDTEQMIKYIRTSKFLLTLDQKDSPYRKYQLTGIIPLSLNNLVPMITSDFINRTYELNGNMVYVDSVSEVLYDAMTLERDSYVEKVQALVRTRDRIIEANKRGMNHIVKQIESSKTVPAIAYKKKTVAKRIKMPEIKMVARTENEEIVKPVRNKQRKIVGSTISRGRKLPVKHNTSIAGKVDIEKAELTSKKERERQQKRLVRRNQRLISTLKPVIPSVPSDDSEENKKKSAKEPEPIRRNIRVANPNKLKVDKISREELKSETDRRKKKLAIPLNRKIPEPKVTLLREKAVVDAPVKVEIFVPKVALGERRKGMSTNRCGRSHRENFSW